ncbi:hypothetical protein ACP70R_023003 [Stipagrostis hirtigluma subsp. patula]
MIGFGSSSATTRAALHDQLTAAYAEAKAAGDSATCVSISCLLYWMNTHRGIPLDETTGLGPRCFTYGPVPSVAESVDAAQIYWVAVKGIRPEELGLRWPLQVYGFVAARDGLDCKRNIVFRRDRNNCQTLTSEESSLELTGPSRAVVACDPINFEIELKVKGSRESEDKILSFLVTEHQSIIARSSYGKLYRESHTNKYCTTELLFAQLRDTVEATIDVKVVDGSWSQFCPRFVARTKSFPDVDFVLLDSRGDGMVASDEGMIKLSRSVVSVESDGELELSTQAREPGSSTVIVSDTIKVTPKRIGTTGKCFNLGFCKMEVCISWSLLPAFL